MHEVYCVPAFETCIITQISDSNSSVSPPVFLNMVVFLRQVHNHLHIIHVHALGWGRGVFLYVSSAHSCAWMLAVHAITTLQIVVQAGRSLGLSRLLTAS